MLLFHMIAIKIDALVLLLYGHVNVLLSSGLARIVLVRGVCLSALTSLLICPEMSQDVLIFLKRHKLKQIDMLIEKDLVWFLCLMA